jgi:hypothetical protein
MPHFTPLVYQENLQISILMEKRENQARPII